MRLLVFVFNHHPVCDLKHQRLAAIRGVVHRDHFRCAHQVQDVPALGRSFLQVQPLVVILIKADCRPILVRQLHELSVIERNHHQLKLDAAAVRAEADTTYTGEGGELHGCARPSAVDPEILERLLADRKTKTGRVFRQVFVSRDAGAGLRHVMQFIVREGETAELPELRHGPIPRRPADPREPLRHQDRPA